MIAASGRRQSCQPRDPPPPQPQEQQSWLQLSPLQRAVTTTAALAASVALLLAAPGGQMAADAADAKKVGTCLLQNCQSALATCLSDTTCVQNLACLQLCNGTPDETSCQIKCGDKYTSGAIDTFNSCAVSQKKCVPQRVDEGLYPVPPDCALDNTFDLNNFQGRWYITAGLNPLFDTFDCQEHFFASPEPGRVFAKINWRIPMMDSLTGDPDFVQRSTMQRFVQDTALPARLVNKDNEYLNYQDTWYVLAFKPDEYVFIYYQGQNDAWIGYGGATVYTRSASLPAEAIPELQAAAERAGLDWSKFTLTNNSCPAHPPERSLPERVKLGAVREAQLVEQFAVDRVMEVEYELENDLRSFGRGFTVLERDLSAGLRAEEAKLASSLSELSKEAVEAERKLEEEAQKAGRMIRRFEMEAQMGPWINWIPQSIRPIIMPLP